MDLRMMLRVIRVGIDPGVNGAISIIWADGDVTIMDLPTKTVTVNKKKKKEIDGPALAQMIRTLPMGDIIVNVERVTAMAKSDRTQGVTSMFNFGLGFGRILQALDCFSIPYNLVMPAVWKRQFAFAPGSPKDASIEIAKSFMQERHHSYLKRKKDNGRADSFLIAMYDRDFTFTFVPGVDTLSSC